MPTYAYTCTECQHAFDVRQSFTDEPLSVCPQCDGRLRKVFSPVGIVFKGSGFYRTDARGGAGKASIPGAPAGAGASESAASGSGSDSSSSSSSAASGGAAGTTSASSGGSGTNGSSSSGTTTTTKAPAKAAAAT